MTLEASIGIYKDCAAYDFDILIYLFLLKLIIINLLFFNNQILYKILFISQFLC